MLPYAPDRPGLAVSATKDIEAGDWNNCPQPLSKDLYHIRLHSPWPQQWICSGNSGNIYCSFKIMVFYNKLQFVFSKLSVSQADK
jgi:hypothetical protein